LPLFTFVAFKMDDKNDIHGNLALPPMPTLYSRVLLQPSPRNRATKDDTTAQNDLISFVYGLPGVFITYF
jgi:hypothetical protein